MRSFKVAAIQFCAGVRVRENVDQLWALIEEAAAQGVAYIQTPEMSNLLQSHRPSFFEEIKPQEEEVMLHAMRQCAAQFKVTLHLGSLAIQVAEKRAANRGFLLSPEGDILAQYDKMHLFDVTLPDGTVNLESATYVQGTSQVLAQIPFHEAHVSLGMTICYDMRFPQLYRALAQKGAQILTAPSAFTVPTGQAHWHVLLRARAIETGSFMIAAAQGGAHECGRTTFGHSVIINPWGDILAEQKGTETGVIYADLDLHEVAQMRAKIPSLLE